MKVLLIQPPVVLSKNELPMISPPLGLAYLAAVLREHQIDVQIFDAVIQAPHGSPDDTESHLGAVWDEIRRVVVAACPDVVGISSMFTSQSQQAHSVSRLIKATNPTIITVMGGAHASTLPRTVLEDKTVDYVVIGEGEGTFLNLLDSLQSGANPETINGIGFRCRGEIKITSQAIPIADLNSIPFPAWDLLPMKDYARLRIGHGLFIAKAPFFSVITSRGCPGACIFCSIHNISGSRWRARSAKNVVDEIEILHRKYGVNQIDFEDDNLVLDSRRMERLLDELIDRRIAIKWSTPNGVAINHIDIKMLPKMRKSGCFYLSFGIESGNERIRNEVIKKPIALAHARGVIKACKASNIWTHGFFIFGIPGETPSTFQETVNFSIELELDSSSYFVATPYPGTPLLELCVNKGYVPQPLNFNDLHIARSSIATGEFTAIEALSWRNQGYKAFARHFLWREFVHFNLLKRLLRVRSTGELELYWRLGMRLLKVYIK